MQLWMLATPVMYSFRSVPRAWQGWYRINPMVGIIEGFRSVTVLHRTPDLILLAYSIIGTTVVWVVAWPLFRYTSQYFADVL
jgi:lipopolysaccharide transport system permease protein